MKQLKPVVTLLLVLCFAPLTRGQGTVVLRNSSATRVQFLDLATGIRTPVPTNMVLNYGLFLNDSATPILPLGVSSSNQPGIIDGALLMIVPGYSPGLLVAAQVRGWAAEFGSDWQSARVAGAPFGETDVRNILLGPSTGPGTILWQATNSAFSNRFLPLVISGGGISVGDIVVAESSNGVVSATFTVSLAPPRAESVSVDYATGDGTALAGQDYASTTGRLVFQPGETRRAIQVLITADVPPEPDEQFFLRLSNPFNAYIQRSVASCLITEASVSEIRLDTAIVFHTVAGRRYAVERSTDLQTWAVVPGSESVVGSGGNVTVYDKSADCSGGRYYRTRLLTE